MAIEIPHCSVTTGSRLVVSDDEKVNWAEFYDLPVRGAGIPAGARVGPVVSAKVFMLDGAAAERTATDITLSVVLGQSWQEQAADFQESLPEGRLGPGL